MSKHPKNINNKIISNISPALTLFSERLSDLIDPVAVHEISNPNNKFKFVVKWKDDAGVPQLNKGWRVQYNNKLGPV